MPKNKKDVAEFKSASFEVVQEIRDLEEGIKKQGRQINAVVATGAWSLGFALFLYHSLSNPNSTYRQFLGNKLDSIYDYNLKQSVSEWTKKNDKEIAHEADYEVTKIIYDARNEPILIEMYNDLFAALRQFYPGQVNSNNLKNYLDKFGSDTALHVEQKKFELKKTYQKWLIEDVINKRLPLFPKRDNAFTEIVTRDIYNLHELPIYEFFNQFSLYYKFDEYYTRHISRLPKLTNKQIDEIREDSVKALSSYLRSLRFIIEVPVFTTGCLLTNMILNRRFPQGIFTKHIVLPHSNLSILDEKQAKTIKDQVKAKYLANEIVQYNTKWANRAAVLIALIGIINSPDKYFTMFSALAFVATAIEFSQWISNDPFAIRRKVQQKKTAEVNRVLSILAKRININYLSPTIDASSVVITFHEGSINNKTYSGKEMCRFIQDLAIKNGMNIESNFNNKIIIPLTDITNNFLAILKVSDDQLITMVINERELKKKNKQIVALNSADLSKVNQPAIEEPIREQSVLRSDFPKKQKEKATKQDNNPRSVASTVAIKPIIRWGARFFDPNSNNNVIRPVENGNGRHFTLQLFKPEDLPNIGMYEALSRVITEHPSFVGNKGQGIKPFNGYAKNEQGEMVRATYKAKPKGDYGYMRAASYEVKSETGEILHVYTANNIYRGH